MVNALVVRKTQLPASHKRFRAAQYVRMSTDYQRYSIENQAAVIAAYAQLHDLSIIRTYRDEGESGLKLKNRAGLAQLLNDVSSDQADFEYILVYDVSRWGRFQDVDESAYYEFICKQAGIKVAYCAEQFDNDGSMVSSIVKNIKRVMAAEYSRELSAKVHAGACRFASLGFQLGGPVAYALQRVLVNEKLQPKGILEKGDRKYLQTDHVRLQPGAANEVAVVQWIFHRFLEVKSEKAIARELNRHGIRLGERNQSILDYLVVPTTGTDRDMIRFTEKDRSRLGMDRFETSGALIRSVSRRVTKPSRASPTKPAQPTKQSRSSQYKRTSGRARR